MGSIFTLRRRAARVVLLDPDDKVLLLQASDPAVAAGPLWWELPGGGMEPGEASEAAAARELFEETGIDGCSVGACVWTQHAVFDFGGYHFDQHEWIHVARTDVRSARYRPAALEALEAVAFKGARWWAPEELVTVSDEGVRIIPPWLPSQLVRAIDAGWCAGAGVGPEEPLHMGDQSGLG